MFATAGTIRRIFMRLQDVDGGLGGKHGVRDYRFVGIELADGSLVSER